MLVNCFTYMRKTLTFTATLAMVSLSWAQGPAASAQKTPPAKVTTSAPVAKAPAAKAPAKPAATNTASVKRPVAKAAAKKAPVVRTTWRTRQAAPTSDRYKEIQDALVARGYLAPEDANGTWSTASQEGLKKFQAEQTLDTTGKIDSLSLIALGLGPRHDSTPVTTRVADGNVQPELGHNQ
jgi:Putative peptidoglycan binding domain